MKWKLYCPIHCGETRSDSHLIYSRKTWALSCHTHWRRRTEGSHCCGTFRKLLHKEEANEYAWKLGIKHIVVRGRFPAISRNSHQGFRLLAGCHTAHELKRGQFLDLQASMQRQSVLSDTLSKRCGQTSVVRVYRACLIPRQTGLSLKAFWRIYLYYFLKCLSPNS